MGDQSNIVSVQHIFGDPIYSEFFRFFHIVSDVAPYWSQVILTLAMAVERYVLICKGSESGNILSNRRRKILYGGVISLIIGICAGVMLQHIHYLANQVILPNKI